jgi:catechol 2,3-dioxygenase-like lactoylglutathione lyase family enzyme
LDDVSDHMGARSAALLTRLAPILYVVDLEAERRFYEALGLHVTYEGPEYPNYIAIGNEILEFGLELRSDFRAEPAAEDLTWQLVVSDVDEAATVCTQAGFAFETRTHEPGEGWRYRTLELVSPNGYRVTLEGPSE